GRAPRRRVAEVREIDGVRDRRPFGRTLHRWMAADDRFEVVDPPALIGSTTPGGVASRLAEFERG
ncbi:MAG: hypothetical protein Q7K37_05890, partial [Dehalococcoidia bacterium]|nr:hypothetical protein [Dehalococcoidia bacterium]